MKLQKKAFKIWFEGNPLLCRQIQEKLFDLGYKWHFEPCLQVRDSRHIKGFFVDAKGTIHHFEGYETAFDCLIGYDKISFNELAKMVPKDTWEEAGDGSSTKDKDAKKSEYEPDKLDPDAYDDFMKGL